MAMTFADLRKNKSSSLEKLQKQLENTGYKNDDDDKYWNLERDKAGNGQAVIRFLDAPKNEDITWVKVFSYGFKGPKGKWYIENSRHSILPNYSEEDPVAEYNRVLWNSGNEEDKEKARRFGRKVKYISNILVLKDPAHPENEGKVFLFRYGSKLKAKIDDMIKPSFDDETPVNPFNLYEGADFKLKVRTVDDYPNYDKSEFAEAGPIKINGKELTDDELEVIWNSEHSLLDIVDPKNFKSYEDLKKKFYSVIDERVSSSKIETLKDDETEDAPEEKTLERNDTLSMLDEEDEDTMAFFKQLSED